MSRKCFSPFFFTYIVQNWHRADRQNPKKNTIFRVTQPDEATKTEIFFYTKRKKTEQERDQFFGGLKFDVIWGRKKYIYEHSITQTNFFFLSIAISYYVFAFTIKTEIGPDEEKK